MPIRIINASERPKELQKNEQVGLLMPADLLEEEVTRTTHDHAIKKEQPEFRKIFGEQGEHLSAQEKEEFLQLMEKHQEQFMLEGSPLGRTNLVHHGIDTQNAHPIKQAPRREPLCHKEDRAAKDVSKRCNRALYQSLGIPGAARQKERWDSEVLCGL